MNYYEMLLARKLAKGELPPNAYLLKTASGSLVSFDDGADLPMPSFVCNIDAVQDLHGYDGPWVGGAGKNKLKVTATSQTTNGVTFTVNADGSVTAVASSERPGNAWLPIATGINISAGSILSGGKSSDIFIQIINSQGTQLYKNGATEATITEDLTNVTVRLGVYSGIFSQTYTFLPMIRTSGDSSFAPYENICPISGHTGVDAFIRGQNLMSSEWELGSYGAGGLPSSDDNKIRTKTMISCIPNKSYAVSFTTSKSNVWVYYYEKDGSFIMRADISNTMRFSTPDYCEFIHFRCDKDSEGVNVSCMLVFGETASTYEPYNPQSQIIQVSWQTEAGEVFGGYVDLVSGVLTVTHKSWTGFTRRNKDTSNKLYNIGEIVDMKRHTASNYISPYFIDSMFEKMNLNEARTAETPSITQVTRSLYVGGYIGKETELDTLLETLQVKYELATPITYQLTPTQIKSLLGNNNAWCSTGDVTLEYFGKGDA